MIHNTITWSNHQSKRAKHVHMIACLHYNILNMETLPNNYGRNFTSHWMVKDPLRYFCTRADLRRCRKASSIKSSYILSTNDYTEPQANSPKAKHKVSLQLFGTLQLTTTAIVRCPWTNVSKPGHTKSYCIFQNIQYLMMTTVIPEKPVSMYMDSQNSMM